MDTIKQHIACDDCGADFDIKFNREEHEPAYCPFCGADLFWDDEDDDDSKEDDKYTEWSDPDDDDYT